MENLKEKLEQALQEHQRESGLHMVGGHAKLVQRLLRVFESEAGSEREQQSESERGRHNWGPGHDSCL